MTVQPKEYEAPDEDLEVDEPETGDTDGGGGDDQAAAPDPAIEAKAREWGWDPSKGPLTAEQFVKRGEEVMPFVKRRAEMAEREAKQLKDSISRLERMQDTVIERLQAQHKAELEAVQARKRQAVENGDVEAYEALDRREDALRAAAPQAKAPEGPQQQQIPQETQEFLARHSWLQSDPVAVAAARAAADMVLATGVTDIKAQLEAAERELRNIRPARFEPAPKPPSPEGGGGRPVKRGKGVADLKRVEREAAQRLIARGIYKDMAEYAADFFGQEN